MEEHGLIREQLDIKILILYVLARLPGPVDRDRLADAVFCDGGVDYFSFSACLADLVATGHIAQEGERFVITEKGREDGTVLESSLPLSVRQRAEEAVKPVAVCVERDALVRAGHTVTENGCSVDLTLSDGEAELLHITALVGDERQARQIEKNFRARGEAFYLEIVELLSRE